MGFSHIWKNVLTVLLFVTIIFASSQVGAMRPLEGAQWLKKESLLLQSVQRGPVTGSGPNPCTYIPEQAASPRILPKNQRTASPTSSPRKAQQMGANPVTHGFLKKKTLT
ncbi:hypothetical protein RGQ29_003874 [Quercus rubra]|uniref:Uncharacterized protein n=1 Tax=Quercus rubra TaxID=3512 RepID=A0AAN7EEG5_QUERU|nr:hypothetical protein RGQ29_003874 [Quercus rubra]